jgi:putative ABC transport system permease protein
VGKWLVHGGFDSTEPKQIVAGVVNAVRDQGLDERAGGILYIPFDQVPQNWIAIAVKAALPIERVVPAMRREIAAFDAQLPLSNVQKLEDIIDASVGQRKFMLQVLGMFAVVAVLLAAVGVYGVIAYFVTQRSHEIGIRVALGASRGRIVRLVTSRVLLSAGAGVAIGLAVAFSVRGLMTRLLYDVSALDLPTYVGGALALFGVAALAALIPTMRATRVSPAVAMRTD